MTGDTVTVQRNAKKVKCLVCPMWFAARRSSAKYCSNACKQTAKRDRDAIFQRKNDIERMIDEIVRTEHHLKLSVLQYLNRKLKYEVMQATPPGKQLIKAIHDYMD